MIQGLIGGYGRGMDGLRAKNYPKTGFERKGN
jgi:hypothetical protein